MDKDRRNSRPEWVHCCLTGRYVRESENSPPYPEQKTWCGREALEFFFVDATHAILNGANGGRLQLCPECSKAIAEALRVGTYSESEQDASESDPYEIAVEFEECSHPGVMMGKCPTCGTDVGLIRW